MISLSQSQQASIALGTFRVYEKSLKRLKLVCYIVILKYRSYEIANHGIYALHESVNFLESV